MQWCASNVAASWTGLRNKGLSWRLLSHVCPLLEIPQLGEASQPVLCSLRNGAPLLTFNFLLLVMLALCL